MFSRKQLALVGLILMLFGLAGSLLTYRISYPKEGLVEEQSITESFAAIDVRSNHAKVEIMSTDENEATIVLRGNIRKNSGYQFSTEIKEETLIVHAKVSKRKFFQFFPKIFSVGSTCSKTNVR
ncbi:MAG: hypothetical protein GX374_07435 [Bacilli bacterium]|nr:hypothetical protein [Bacilli bacterium]